MEIWPYHSHFYSHQQGPYLMLKFPKTRRIHSSIIFFLYSMYCQDLPFIIHLPVPPSCHWAVLHYNNLIIAKGNQKRWLPPSSSQAAGTGGALISLTHDLWLHSRLTLQFIIYQVRERKVSGMGKEDTKACFFTRIHHHILPKSIPKPVSQREITQGC